MLFSIIIPTCNRNELLIKCLEALRPTIQKIPIEEYEVIVSDDSASNIAKELIDSNYSWIKWVEGPKKGPAANRNKGAKMAKADWLIFLDDDVIPDSTLLFSYKSGVFQHHEVLVLEGKTYSEKRSKQWDEAAPINLTGGNLWSCNFGIKKQYFFFIGMFDENFLYPNLEDNDLKFRIDSDGKRIPFIESASVFHPYRKVASARKLSRYHESWLYYNKKNKNIKGLSLRLRLFYQIIRNRLISVYYTKSFSQKLSGIINLIKEVFFTFTNIKIWKRS